MEEIVKADNTEIAEIKENSVIQISENLLFDARASVSDKQTISMPIAELSSLGAGVSSLLPSLRTAVQTTSFNVDGLYRLANAGVGDALKVAKNGNFWGAFKTASGGSKFAQLAEAGPLSATSTTVMPIDPATMMIAVALFSIEKQLKGIEETGKKILSFLENEKESKIEGDVETLMSIISKFKYSWDNKQFITANYKMVADLQRTARANMNSYQKKLSGITSSKQMMLAQSQVQSAFSDLLKDFKYYRLSLFTFALSSLLEVMLGGNFKEEYILGVIRGTARGLSTLISAGSGALLIITMTLFFGVFSSFTNTSVLAQGIEIPEASVQPDFTNDDAWGDNNPYSRLGLTGQCTWFAWGRFYEIYGYDPGFRGNGWDCAAELVASHPDKFELSYVPAAGAVFSTIGHNHVGIVIAVDGDKITVQDGNLDGKSNPLIEAITDWHEVTWDISVFVEHHGGVIYAVPINVED